MESKNDFSAAHLMIYPLPDSNSKIAPPENWCSEDEIGQNRDGLFLEEMLVLGSVFWFVIYAPEN